MHILTLSIRNFGPFRGEHALELGPKFYAVTARRNDDQERSNWCGKSSLLEAVRFALFGEHRHRLEDSWITNGEPEGEVLLGLSNSNSIRRWRVRGKATKLEAKEGEQKAVGDAAQEWIGRWLGLGKGDFDACHLAQGQASAFVTGDPTERTERISAWCGISKLEAGHDLASEKVAKLELDLRCALSKKELAEDRRNKALAGNQLDELGATLLGCQRQLEALRAKLQSCLSRQAELAKDSAKTHARLEYQRTVKMGKELREKLESSRYRDLLERRGDLKEKVQQEAQKLGLILRDRDEKRTLARGGFSGTCPVAGIRCPAEVEIKGMVQHHAEEHHKLHLAAGTVEGELRADEKDLSEVEEGIRALESEAGRLKALRAIAQAQKEASEGAEEVGQFTNDVEAGNPEELEDQIVWLRRQEELVAVADQELRSAARVAKEADAEVKEASAEAAELEGELKVARAASAIFGRHGAQRRVASGVLLDVEARANALLAKVGVDLSVKLEWEREGTGAASECRECGWGYPSSRKVTSCGACGVSRGANIVRQFQPVLSRRSGAAGDLSGLALAFGAFGWLRDARDARWAVAMLDECFSQVDKAHRRGVANKIGGMMREAGFVQGFVVSHDAATVGAMPARIEIVSDGTFAKVEVVG